jgi:hypothetical protein
MAISNDRAGSTCNPMGDISSFDWIGFNVRFMWLITLILRPPRRQQLLKKGPKANVPDSLARSSAQGMARAFV